MFASFKLALVALFVGHVAATFEECQVIDFTRDNLGPLSINEYNTEMHFSGLGGSNKMKVTVFPNNETNTCVGARPINTKIVGDPRKIRSGNLGLGFPNEKCTNFTYTETLFFPGVGSAGEPASEFENCWGNPKSRALGSP